MTPISEAECLRRMSDVHELTQKVGELLPKVERACSLAESHNQILFHNDGGPEHIGLVTALRPIIAAHEDHKELMGEIKGIVDNNKRTEQLHASFIGGISYGLGAKLLSAVVFGALFVGGLFFNTKYNQAAMPAPVTVAAPLDPRVAKLLNKLAAEDEKVTVERVSVSTANGHPSLFDPVPAPPTPPPAKAAP